MLGRDLGVELGRGDRDVAEELLDDPDVGPVGEHVGGAGVAQHVGADPVAQTRPSRRGGARRRRPPGGAVGRPAAFKNTASASPRRRHAGRAQPPSAVGREPGVEGLAGVAARAAPAAPWIPCRRAGPGPPRRPGRPGRARPPRRCGPRCRRAARAGPGRGGPRVVAADRAEQRRDLGSPLRALGSRRGTPGPVDARRSGRPAAMPSSTRKRCRPRRTEGPGPPRPGSAPPLAAPARYVLDVARRRRSAGVRAPAGQGRLVGGQVAPVGGDGVARPGPARRPARRGTPRRRGEDGGVIGRRDRSAARGRAGPAPGGPAAGRGRWSRRPAVPSAARSAQVGQRHPLDGHPLLLDPGAVGRAGSQAGGQEDGGELVADSPGELYTAASSSSRVGLQADLLGQLAPGRLLGRLPGARRGCRPGSRGPAARRPGGTGGPG